MTVRFVYYDYDGSVYWEAVRDLPYVPSEGDELFLDTDNECINADGWNVAGRIFDIKRNEWLLSIKHRNDGFGKGINRFKD